MRIREAISIAVGALGTTVLTVTAPAAAPGAAAVPPPPPPRNQLTIDDTGRIAPDGTITLTGTYRCRLPGGLPDGTVLVAANVIQGGHAQGIGGSRATCDGRRHPWRNTARPYRPAFRPGPARADGTLMQFRKNKSGLLLPHFLAVAPEHDVVLVTRP
ncbi:DUF6299 family protein [Streptomyces cinnamoneus]|uniref:DUF6299 domain-containing protein n=1 Tax=Streptomyces cinnamoneus TaxID=53446 RepID=A0A918TVB1_STRCJ|nr:DUF6299 family protein [Streptomyces cinnamoneus]GHC64364.1 hypothetical protein GCM10010507_47110 [Streptomyces cinnamoneus]